MKPIGLLLAISLVAAACSGASSPSASHTPATSPAATAHLSATDAIDVPALGVLRPGRYSIRPGTDPDSTLRVLFTVPSEGWRRFEGAFKNEQGQDTGGRFVGVNFFDVRSVVTEACEDHSGANPPLGPTVADLATAAAALEPFEVASAPTDVEAYGHRGNYLELVVPDIPHTAADDGTIWTECQRGTLMTWIAAPLSYAFYGYYAPGQVEELTILDVRGRRLMISATWHPKSPPADVAEMRTVLESIEIQP